VKSEEKKTEAFSLFTLHSSFFTSSSAVKYFGYEDKLTHMSPLGLIAGEGAFPILVARGARAAGRSVVCAGLRGHVDPEIEKEVDHFSFVGTLRLNQWARVLRKRGCEEAIMVGRVGKSRAHSKWKYFQYLPDVRTLRVWFTRLRHDKRDHAVLLAVVDELAKDGITLIDSTKYTSDQLATPGVMTRTQPTPRQSADIDFGWPLCKAISQSDIGQALAILDKDVIAVEAIEGTDAMIERAGHYCKTGGWTLIKVSNIHQDMRIDVPTVGEKTIEKLAQNKCGCLVLEVGKTMMLEKEKVLAMAERMGISVVGKE
jgi:UDP-2,3-diacylglucosamine hydrolase